MNADRWGISLFRSFIALILGLVFAWFGNDLSFKNVIMLYAVIYLFVYLKDVGAELTERLKSLGAILDEDDEYDDAAI